MDSSTVAQSDRGSSPDPCESLKNCVDRLKAALEKWDNAWAALTRSQSEEERQQDQEERRKQEELFAQAMAGWPEEIRNETDPVKRCEKARDAGLVLPAIAPEKVNEFINQNPEHQRICRAGLDRKDAEAEIRDLGAKIYRELDRLHRRNLNDPTIGDALVDFHRLTELSTQEGGTRQFPLGSDGARELIQSLEELLARRVSEPSPESGEVPQTDAKTRYPKSAERTRLRDNLCGELSAVKLDLEAALTVVESRRKHPDFEVWGLLKKFGYEAELDDPNFRPKQLASTLVTCRYGVRPETVRKDPPRSRKI